MNWYNLPLYYDVSFSHEMRDELQFIKTVASNTTRSRPVSILEPACGTGRLLVPLARAGFDCYGFDKNIAALDYLRNKLQRNRLPATIVEADMASFYPGRKFDAAVCTVDTFRHLLSEQDALGHLNCIGKALKPGGIYILGMHLQTGGKSNLAPVRWTHRRGRLTVKTSMRLVKLDRKKRRETLKVVLQPITSSKQKQHTSEYDLRTYSLEQFRQLMDKTGMFKIKAVYDEYYDINHPVKLNGATEYAVFLLQRT